MKNRLSIQRECWPEVTGTPHFIVDLAYQGCRLRHDDIYFDKLENLVPGLDALEQARKGSLGLRGGSRFDALLEITSTGAVEFRFRTEEPNDFPGRLTLQGHFLVSGEFTSRVLESLVRLFRDGDEFILEDESRA